MDIPAESQTNLPVMAFAVLGWIGLFGAILSIAHLQFLFPKLARQMGMPERLQSVMMVVHRAVGLSFYLIMFYCNGWRFRRWPILAANLFGIIGMWMLFAASDISGSFVAYVLVAPFTSITYYCAISYAAHAFSKERKGLASGINESIISAGFVLGPIVGGLIGDGFSDFRLPFAVVAGAILVITVAQLSLMAVWRKVHAGQ